MRLFKSLKARILKSIITWTTMGKKPPKLKMSIAVTWPALSTFGSEYVPVCRFKCGSYCCSCGVSNCASLLGCSWNLFYKVKGYEIIQEYKNWDSIFIQDCVNCKENKCQSYFAICSLKSYCICEFDCFRKRRKRVKGPEDEILLR